jgi:hypothetical protein
VPLARGPLAGKVVQRAHVVALGAAAPRAHAGRQRDLRDECGSSSNTRIEGFATCAGTACYGLTMLLSQHSSWAA